MGVQLLNYLKKAWDIKKNQGIAGIMPLKRKNSQRCGKFDPDENLYTFMTEHFITKQEQLDQFKQNDEKPQDEDGLDGTEEY